jgi:dTDP-4-amino-4,6-dideoxygalactose transaminase
MKVPFLDLKSQYESIKAEIHEAIQQVLENTAFAGGPFVAQFEKDFARYSGCKEAVGVGSGTDALWLSLLALGIGPGDEVITVPDTFIATAEAITFCGANPVFVDVEETTYNMDPVKLSAAITQRTKAIIPVHLFGQMADMDPIMDISRKHKIPVIEDACQAHGAEYKARQAGTIGDAGCFSFYPGKNLGAYGEAGAIVTNNPETAQKIRILRDHGQSAKYYHDVIGWNARMDGIQGAILSAKLKHLNEWNEARRKNANLYQKLLVDLPDVILPLETHDNKHVYHIYAIRVQDRSGFISGMADKSISCGIHYPIPIHLQQAYHSLKRSEGSFPVAEKCAKEFVSLPMFPELTNAQIEYISSEIKSFFKCTSRSSIR